jgi:hypothetical protein
MHLFVLRTASSSSELSQSHFIISAAAFSTLQALRHSRAYLGAWLRVVRSPEQRAELSFLLLLAPAGGIGQAGQ